MLANFTTRYLTGLDMNSPRNYANHGTPAKTNSKYSEQRPVEVVNSSPYSHQGLGIVFRQARRQGPFLLHLFAGWFSVALYAGYLFDVWVLFRIRLALFLSTYVCAFMSWGTEQVALTRNMVLGLYLRLGRTYPVAFCPRVFWQRSLQRKKSSY